MLTIYRDVSDAGDLHADINEPPSEEEESSDEEEPQIVRPYSALLQAFQDSTTQEKHRNKRRKLDGGSRQEEYMQDVLEESGSDHGVDEEEHEDDAEAIMEDDSDDDQEDPFEAHFAIPDENELSLKLKAITQNQWVTRKTVAADSAKCLISTPGAEQTPSKFRKFKSPKDLKLKQKLRSPAEEIISDFNPVERDLVPHIFDYQDLLFGAKTVRNSTRLRQITCLHALNHIFKTRDKVIKNNARLVKDEEAECRDQGFTRPKVLILLETRQACVRFVETITSLCEFEQQENKNRFADEYSQTEEKFSDDKPEDFRELFEGNDDNEFRIGMKFTRKTAKFFSKFYNSDIIFASPLGLRRAIEKGDGKKKDSDFLSSIEVVILDQADAMLMQNWEHVEYVFDELNLRPKDLHGCDISRVRKWYLDEGTTVHLRQTIVLSAYLTPELNSLFSKHMRNVEGRVKYHPNYDGAIENIGLQIKQTFSRYESPSATNDPDARFKYFTSSIIPALARYPKPPEGGQGILIFIPSYLDFVRIRNYFANSTATQNISFGAISEYVNVPDVRRARSHFLTGRHSVLIYTGRAHHFRRFYIRGVKRVIMYALPDNPIFYQELVSGYLGATISEGTIDPSEATVRVMFSKWDGFRLERVVGSKRVAGMLKDTNGDTFDFI
jgi:U3 small nucleolar RNA-associated protein 25